MLETIDRERVFGEKSGAVERIAPGFFDARFEAEHLARYRWAAGRVKGRRVLDVACGTGYGVTILRRTSAGRVLSIDLSRDALKYGRVRFRIEPACADASKLPFVRESFETVVSLETIEHLNDPSTFLSELYRVLCCRGVLLLSTPNVVRSSRTNPYHVREMELVELKSLLTASGFRIDGVWGQHWRSTIDWVHKTRGLRRVLWEAERMALVTRWPTMGFAPQYWCVRAIKR